MLQTALGASSINRASVFEWHKRFKEDRESVRDDERCGWSKEVRTPELIGQIKIFMDKDRRVSIETISAQFDVSVGAVHTIISEELKMRKICAKFVPMVLRKDHKERRCHDSREMVELINSDPAVLDALVTIFTNPSARAVYDTRSIFKQSLTGLSPVGTQCMQIMPVLSKKGIIKSLWVDLLCLAFLGLGEPPCFHWELCLLDSGSQQQIQLSSQVTRAQCNGYRLRIWTR